MGKKKKNDEEEMTEIIPPRGFDLIFKDAEAGDDETTSMPCAIYSISIAEPINPLDINEKSHLSSQDFYNAIESTVVQDIIRSTGKIDNNLMLAVIGTGVVIWERRKRMMKKK